MDAESGEGKECYSGSEKLQVSTEAGCLAALKQLNPYTGGFTVSQELNHPLH